MQSTHQAPDVGAEGVTSDAATAPPPPPPPPGYQLPVAGADNEEAVAAAETEEAAELREDSSDAGETVGTSGLKGCGHGGQVMLPLTQIHARRK